MKVIAIIPARGGSKGIPDKNIKVLGGKPLIAYTIEAALNSKLLTDVMVSTDSEEIANVARASGGNVPYLRPAHLADDKSATIDVIVHCINFLEKSGKVYDAVCLLQPTSPFRKSIDIDKAVKRFEEQKTDSLISVINVPHEFNPHWAFLKDETGNLTVATGDSQIIKRRQDLPKTFIRNGSIYLTKTSVIKQQSLYGKSIGYVEMDSTLHVNLDTMQDWKRAEKLMGIYDEQ